MGTLLSIIGFQQKTHSFHEQLQRYDKEIRYYHTRQRKYNVRVNSVPSRISQLIMLLGIVICIPLYTFVPSPDVYYVISGVIVLFISITWIIKKVVVKYFNNTVSSYNYDIEQLLLKQKEILEDLKQQNDYYATHDLIQKYERAIQVLQRHVSRKRKRLQTLKNNLKKKKDSIQIIEEPYEDDMETTEILLSNYPYFSYEIFKKYASTNSVQNTLPNVASSSAQLDDENQQGEKIRTTITTQTDSSLGIETHLQQTQTQQMLEQSMNKLFSMVSTLNENQKRAQKIQSLQNIAIENDMISPPILKSHSFRIPKEKSTISIGTDSTEDTSNGRKRSNSFNTAPPTTSTPEKVEEEKISDKKPTCLPTELEEELTKLKQKEQSLKEREAKLIYREYHFEKQLGTLALQKQSAIAPNALYSSDLTGKYKIHVERNANGFVENKSTTKPGWFDRVLDRIVGQSPENCYALICSRCCSHNGLLMVDDVDNHSGYKCWNCNYLNIKSSSVSDSVSVASEVATDILEEHDEETNEANENEEKQEAEEKTEHGD